MHVCTDAYTHTPMEILGVCGALDEDMDHTSVHIKIHKTTGNKDAFPASSLKWKWM